MSEDLGSYPENDNETEASHKSRLVLEAVVDKTFVAFLEALGEDWENERRREAERPSNSYGPGVNGWENVGFGEILEAAVACWRDSRPESAVGDDGNIWRAAARIIWCGKYYE
ncbi:hypothetical protein ACSBOB_21575 [Mesorhizobium sp. ASY16-5R]|uniref:hypothetical protein n=1 Tax=Mesorhizobium sp. ASY16-5R TaxID=3445772 RepID=UPI003FA0645B